MLCVRALGIAVPPKEVISAVPIITQQFWQKGIANSEPCTGFGTRCERRRTYSVKYAVRAAGLENSAPVFLIEAEVTAVLLSTTIRLEIERQA